MKKLLVFLWAMLMIFGVLGTAGADTTIDNDIAYGTLGHYSINMWDGGESREAYVTADRFNTGDIYTEYILFDYYSYVDIGDGNGGVRLGSGSDATLTGDDEASSSGSFTGSGGNTINWDVVSSIPDLGSLMTSIFTFTAETGTLGELKFFQYMDEDIESVGDDVFFTRGSVVGNDLELFTVDNSEVYGVSHGGAYSTAMGLENATFLGWAADEYNDMKPRIGDGTQSISLSGVIDTTSLPPFTHPQVGSAFGPNDIVSVLAWEVNSDLTSATIITTLGGVPSVEDIPEPEPSVPEPATMFLLGSGLIGLGVFGRKKLFKK